METFFFVDQIFNFEAQCSLFDLHVYVYVYIKCIYIIFYIYLTILVLFSKCSLFLNPLHL